MILHREKPKEFTHAYTQWELINKFCKVPRIQDGCIKSIAFLYTTNKQSKHEVKNIIPFTTISRRIKYLGINLTKEVWRCVLWKLQNIVERL